MWRHCVENVKHSARKVDWNIFKLGMFECYDSNYDSSYHSDSNNDPLQPYSFPRQAWSSMAVNNPNCGSVEDFETLHITQEKLNSFWNGLDMSTTNEEGDAYQSLVLKNERVDMETHPGLGGEFFHVYLPVIYDLGY